MKRIQFGVLQSDENWRLFDSLEEAVKEEGDGVEVFKFEPISLGKFRRAVVPVKEKDKVKKGKS